MAALKNKTVRLSETQIDGLKQEARKMSSKTGIQVDWTALIRLAIDELLVNRQRKKAA